MSDTANRP